MQENIFRSPVLIGISPALSEEQARAKLAMQIPGYPPELFSFISIEDVVPFKYFVTSYGRVFTVNGRELFPDEYVIAKNNNTYLRIELSCSSYIKRRKFFVHRLVANAFIPKTEDDIINKRNIVNHKFNKDGRCNYAWNLEWTTDSENTLHGLYFNEPYDEQLFNPNYILDRKDIYISYD